METKDDVQNQSHEPEDERLFGKDYPHLCLTCRAVLDQTWGVLNEGPDTDDGEAACTYMYDHKLFCKGWHCKGRLREILDTMDVPESRKADVSWLNRNLGICNSGHQDFEEAINLIKSELRRM